MNAWARSRQASDQTETIAAHAAQARLVVIGRAEPAARRINDRFACNHDSEMTLDRGAELVASRPRLADKRRLRCLMWLPGGRHDEER